ncbi:L,D-transpeptidase [Smaragdicoccus niigatensis]|uniref:L,D-transpeptidase n=1 Tax=Smaragdicoccus niigatensis TaxID=359359 RepID=UPI001FDF204D|nr:L,D-transpeptidase [Smaragdicoccus niigatensis]
MATNRAHPGSRVVAAVSVMLAAGCASKSPEVQNFGDARPLVMAAAPAVTAPKPSPGLAYSPCSANTDAKLIEVSLSKQFAWMCEGPREIRTSPVTTGAVASGQGTPTGTWYIEAKEVDRTLEGPGYSDFVHYWMPFFGDFGFHDASWQVIPFGAANFVTDGSHGCVRLPDDAMRWLYDWTEVGTTVTVTP